jgi:hypothetical protein
MGNQNGKAAKAKEVFALKNVEKVRGDKGNRFWGGFATSSATKKQATIFFPLARRTFKIPPVTLTLHLKISYTFPSVCQRGPCTVFAESVTEIHYAHK